MLPTGLKTLLLEGRKVDQWPDQVEFDIPKIAFLGELLNEEEEKKVPELKLKPGVIKILVPSSWVAGFGSAITASVVSMAIMVFYDMCLNENQ